MEELPMAKKTVEDIKVTGKRVLVRCDFNVPMKDGKISTETNYAGGVNGGITNGNPLVVRVAFKPTPSIAREQATFDTATGNLAPLRIAGRHDSCVALRGQVVVEAMMAITLAELALRA